MFAGRAKGLLKIGTPERCFTGVDSGLIRNMRVGLKETNTLAYRENYVLNIWEMGPML